MRVRCGAICLIALFAALSNQERSASKQLAAPLPYTQSQSDLVLKLRRSFVTSAVSHSLHSSEICSKLRMLHLYNNLSLGFHDKLPKIYFSRRRPTCFQSCHGFL